LKAYQICPQQLIHCRRSLDYGFWLGFEQSLYYVLLHEIIMPPTVEGSKRMEKRQEKEELRWQVVKAMLDEFPKLKQKVREYVN
jgi:hypothetical protein